MICVRCGSRRTAPILYGMPAFDENMERKLNTEKLYLGGCCMTGHEPRYYCFECNKGFATPPLLVVQDGQEDYRKVITSIKFSIGGYFGGYLSIQLKKDNKRALLQVHKENNIADILGSRPELLSRMQNGNYKPLIEQTSTYLMTIKEWKKLINKLYCKLYIHEWKKDYTDNHISDGEQWCLDITLTKDRHRLYRGSNAYPPYWGAFIELIKPYFKEADIELQTMHGRLIEPDDDQIHSI